MSDVYNPETVQFEKLQALEMEARDLAQRLEKTRDAEDRKMLSQQLHELESEINTLKRKLKP